jgi:hypothetical protein
MHGRACAPATMVEMIRIAFMTLLCAGLMGCGGSPTGPSSSERTFLTFSSQLGDPVGGGLTYRADLSDGKWDANVDYEANRFLWVHFTAPPGSAKPWWNLNLAAPVGQTLGVGAYEGAVGWGTRSTGPQFSFGWDGKSCSDVNGRFVIEEFRPGTTRGTLDRVLASFEMRCGNAIGRLTGRVSVVNNPWR